MRASATILDRVSIGTKDADTLLRDTLLVVGASVLLALSAHVQIPGPLPLTMQTFVVVLVAAALGSKRGAAAVLAYLAQGAAGLPVFAHGTAGPAYFVGPTGGYLIGFLVAAFVVGRMAERGWDRRFSTAIVTFLLGHLLILSIGFVWRSGFVGPAVAAADGFIKTMPGMLIKSVLAAMVLPIAWRWAGKSDESDGMTAE
ncbi:MAG: biotin transporter BioY [Phycisphaerales bacterium]|nr:biotin transporter BioY [Phycisphaerales bacterium]MCB9862541.1 biotin transporter BioY [Phycisphaerales bacterium]